MEKRDQDRIGDKAAAFGSRLAAEFIKQTSQRLRGNSDQQVFLFMREFDDLVDQFTQKLHPVVYDASVASFVTGAAGAVAPLDIPAAGTGFLPPIGNDPKSLLYPPGDGPSLYFPILERSLKALTESTTLSPEVYYSIAAAARDNAFTVTANLKIETIDRMREILQENAATSGNRQAFMEAVRKEIPSLPINDAHLEQVFRNNVNASYSDGGEAALADPVVQDHFPYRAYYPIHDDRARPEHLMLERLGLSGTNVYHRLDPVWALFRPPWDWNCRCGWNPLSIRQAARKGVAVAKQWLETGIEPKNQFVELPKFLPSPSWRRTHVGVA